MSVLHLTLDELRARGPLFQNTSVAVGNFDGVHIGHAHILQLAIRHASSSGETPIALTFDPHPRAVVGRGAPPALATRADRDRLMKSLGIASVVILHFDEQVAALSAEQFVRDVVVSGLGAARVVVGDNFRFGRGAHGSPQLLMDEGRRHGFVVHAAPTVRAPTGEVVSSSVIRNMLAEGNVEGAARLLNRPYEIVGRLVGDGGAANDEHGSTVRLEPEERLLVPGNGTYRAKMTGGSDSTARAGVVVVGELPGADSSRVVAVRASDFPDVRTGESVRIQFLRPVTDEEQS